jgi:cytochrome c oxidase subunit 2
VVLPVVLLGALLVLTLIVMRDHTLVAEQSKEELTVEVTGVQWWWDVRYRPVGGGTPVSSANEIHIPVGRPVRIVLRSRDVIHSFWVPQLQGKLDLVPGNETVTWIQADSAGVFRGQCAEFCGAQHAHMAFMVVAVPPDEFDAWLEHQRRPAPEPTDSVTLRGRAVLERTACAMCHTVRGTGARASTGPDLTHLASRRTLAAGTLPNTPGHLAGWIGDPQGIKPGNHMPRVPLSGPDLQALLAYLGTLR